MGEGIFGEPQGHDDDPMYVIKPRFSAMRALLVGGALAATLIAVAPGRSLSQSLRGSMASLDRQNRVAREHAYTFMDDGDRVQFFASQGWLVRVEPTRDFVLRAVSFPYARPEVELFVRRLSQQYRASCGEQLVVTSLTRPTTRQPRNASDRSVHPTGMALDLRRPNRGTCRTWLEGVLLDLERAGVIEATLERLPVHYHIAVFPRQYVAYVESRAVRQTAGSPQVVLAERPGAPEQPAAAEQSAVSVLHAVTVEPTANVAAPERLPYKVRRGDSLWTIARTHGTTVDELRSVNQLDSSRIYVGQLLDVPIE